MPKKKNGSLGTKLFLVGTLLFGYFLHAESVLAAAPLTLSRVIMWLKNQIVSYGFGKAIDKLVGQDHERQLINLKRELETQLARSTKAEKSRLQEQIEVTQSQLNSLHELLYSQPGARELADLSSRVKADIPRILSMVAEHETRLGHLGADVRDLRQRLEEVEKRLGMHSIGPVVTLKIGTFSSTGRSVPRDLQFVASEFLAGELSRDRRIRLQAGHDVQPDLVVEGTILRYSVERRPYSGYGIRTVKLIYTLDASLRLLDGRGEQVYLSRTYQRQKPEVFLDGVEHTASGHGAAYDLLGELLKVGAEETLSFIFGEEIETLGD